MGCSKEFESLGRAKPHHLWKMPGNASASNAGSLIRVSWKLPFSYHLLELAAWGEILWWYVFASGWNGLSLLWKCAGVPPEVIVVSDNSISWGCGAFCLPH